jgi:Alkylmercury lyase
MSENAIVHHQGLDEVLEEFRLTVYRSLASTGRLPDFDRLAEVAGSPVRAGEAIVRLAVKRAWALGSDGEIELAHPFATRSFGYSVMSAQTLWWGGCCWDAFAIPHLVPDCGAAIVAGACPACDRPLVWRVDTASPPEGSERAHFLVPTSRMWDDVIHTCANQLLFCGDDCIDAWLVRTGHEEGYRMDLATLWRFASGWYTGRLDRGYERREPAQALSYFWEVGLRGPFWGLPDNDPTE